MRNIGGLLAFLGGLAIILDLVNRVPTFLFWIYSWGNEVAWGIKIALIVVGGIMYMFGSDTPEDETPEE